MHGHLTEISKTRQRIATPTTLHHNASMLNTIAVGLAVQLVTEIPYGRWDVRIINLLT